MLGHVGVAHTKSSLASSSLQHSPGSAPDAHDTYLPDEEVGEVAVEERDDDVDDCRLETLSWWKTDLTTLPL